MPKPLAERTRPAALAAAAAPVPAVAQDASTAMGERVGAAMGVIAESLAADGWSLLRVERRGRRMIAEAVGNWRRASVEANATSGAILSLGAGARSLRGRGRGMA